MFVFDWLRHYFETLTCYVAFRVGCPARLVNASWCTVFAAIGLSKDSRVALQRGTIFMLATSLALIAVVGIPAAIAIASRRREAAGAVAGAAAGDAAAVVRRGKRKNGLATELRMLPKVPGSEGCASRLRGPPIK